METTDSPAAGRGRRELWAWLALTVLGSCLVLFAGGRAWMRATGAKGADVVVPTGDGLSPVLTPLALAALAGVVAVLATKGAGRRIVAALLALCGAGAAAGTWAALGSATVTGWLREHNVLRGTDLPWQVVPLWPAVAVLGALLVLAGGVLAFLRGHTWAGMSARYDRNDGVAGASERVPDDRALWDALDRGDDPTDPTR